MVLQVLLQVVQALLVGEVMAQERCKVGLSRWVAGGWEVAIGQDKAQASIGNMTPTMVGPSCTAGTCPNFKRLGRLIARCV
jgi:hypothetical protein